jgi:hypothetical protein
MTWGRRVRLYLFGFGIGLLICWVVFIKNGNRDLTGWFPGSRVTKFITLSKKLDADSSLICKLKCNGISLDDIRKATATGDVDFGKSNVNKDPDHEYDVKMTVKGKTLEIYFSENMRDSTAKILQVYPPLDGSNCNCK